MGLDRVYWFQRGMVGEIKIVKVNNGVHRWYISEYVKEKDGTLTLKYSYGTNAWTLRGAKDAIRGRSWE